MSTILAWIGVIWGGLLVANGIRGLLAGELGAGAYKLGQLTGILFGLLLFFVGIRALRPARQTPPE